MNQIAVFPLLVLCCFSAAVGMAGAVLGVWLHSRHARARFQALQRTFETARDEAERKLHRVLACVPQWVQQSVRLEMEYQVRRQLRSDVRRWDEQRRWQSEQDARRQAEWRALQKMPAQAATGARRRRLHGPKG